MPPIWFKTRAYAYNFSIGYEDDAIRRETQEAKTIPFIIDLNSIISYSRICRSFEWQPKLEDIGGTRIEYGNHHEYIQTKYEDFCAIMEKYVGKPIDETCLL